MTSSSHPRRRSIYQVIHVEEPEYSFLRGQSVRILDIIDEAPPYWRVICQRAASTSPTYDVTLGLL